MSRYLHRSSPSLCSYPQRCTAPTIWKPLYRQPCPRAGLPQPRARRSSPALLCRSSGGGELPEGDAQPADKPPPQQQQEQEEEQEYLTIKDGVTDGALRIQLPKKRDELSPSYELTREAAVKLQLQVRAGERAAWQGTAQNWLSDNCIGSVGSLRG